VLWQNNGRRHGLTTRHFQHDGLIRNCFWYVVFRILQWPKYTRHAALPENREWCAKHEKTLFQPKYDSAAQPVMQPQGRSQRNVPWGCVDVFQPGFRRRKTKLPGAKSVTTVLCGCSKIDPWITAQGSMSDANIYGSFRCSKKVEKQCRRETSSTTISKNENAAAFLFCV